MLWPRNRPLLLSVAPGCVSTAQLGFAMLFVGAFPGAAPLALVGLTTHTRATTKRMLDVARRPLPHAAQVRSSSSSSRRFARVFVSSRLVSSRLFSSRLVLGSNAETPRRVATARTSRPLARRHAAIRIHRRPPSLAGHWVVGEDLARARDCVGDRERGDRRLRPPRRRRQRRRRAPVRRAARRARARWAQRRQRHAPPRVHLYDVLVLRHAGARERRALWMPSSSLRRIAPCAHTRPAPHVLECAKAHTDTQLLGDRVRPPRRARFCVLVFSCVCVRD